MPKCLNDLTARQVLALAIQSEEEDGCIYGDFPAAGPSVQAMQVTQPSTH